MVDDPFADVPKPKEESLEQPVSSDVKPSPTPVDDPFAGISQTPTSPGGIPNIYDRAPSHIPLTLIVRARSGYGKTYLANILNGVENTHFADLHATNSTLETCKLLGNSKIKKVMSWSDLEIYTEMVIKYNKPGKNKTFVMDPASQMVTFAIKGFQDRHGKLPGKPSKKTANNWGEVWESIRVWMKNLTDAGWDIVFTVQMNRKPKEDEEGLATEEWIPHEWKDLEYETTGTIEITKGIEIKNGEVLFPWHRFHKIHKARWVDFECTAPYILGPFTRENLIKWLSTEYFFKSNVDFLRDLMEGFSSSTKPSDIKLVEEIAGMLGKREE